MLALHKELEIFVEVVRAEGDCFIIKHPKTGNELKSPKDRYDVSVSSYDDLYKKKNLLYDVLVKDRFGTMYSFLLREYEYKDIISKTRFLLINPKTLKVYLLYKEKLDWFLDDVHGRRMQREVLKSMECYLVSKAWREYATKKKGGDWELKSSEVSW